MELLLPAVVSPTSRDLTLAGLITLYKADPYSRYQNLQYCTRQNLDRILRRLTDEHGHEFIAAIKPRVVMDWHRAWLGPDGTHVTMAHSMIGALRAVISYGSTMLQLPDCVTLRTTLSGLRFSMGKPRTIAITAEQVIAVRAEAHKMGWPSIALAQAIQFSCIFRQKDVIGQYVPATEKVTPLLVDGDRFWLSGIHWGEVASNLVLRHITSKKQKLIEFDFNLAPMIRSELKFVPEEQILSRGPIVICERTKLPWTASEFRRVWRQIAKAAGIPDNVRNMDSRAGAITEAFELGATGSAIRQSATHSQESQTNQYDRSRRAISTVATLRGDHHEKMENAA